jgi:hypothetical protein
VDVEKAPEAAAQSVLLCPRDGGKLVELKEKPAGARSKPTEKTQPVVTGWWCEEGHNLEIAELPVETVGD